MSREGAEVARSNTASRAGGIRRAALVTGAGKRIGRALALALAEDGWFVFVHYHRSVAEARATVTDIRRRGGGARAMRADLAAASQAGDLVARCTEPGTALRCLVNSASLFELDRIATLTADSFDRHIAVNLRAPLLLSQAFAAQVPAEGGGVIVNLLDQKLWNLNPDFLSYTLGKAGLGALTTLLAQALAPRVRVAGIAPGLTLRSGSQTDARFAETHAQNPLGVGVEPEDLVRALRFILATPSYTGDTIVIDSGEHLVGRPRDVEFDRSGRPVRRPRR
jgi:NAD(P)-dependent dehydrogenase (short-subunit alcohol dehydrogenase family)